MADLNALCGACYMPHALRDHARVCLVAGCACMGFVPQQPPPAPEPEKPAAPAAPDDDPGLGWYGGFIV
jgi:hypothetical protein